MYCRQMRRPLALAAVVLLAGVPDAAARAIDVTTNADTLAADGSCSLREAITSANLDAAPFTGPGECPSGDGGDAIAIPAFHIVADRFGISDDMNEFGDLDILGPTTITGAGSAATTIQGSAIDRVLDVGFAGTVTLSGVTITGGHAPNGVNGSPDNKPLVMSGNGQNATGQAGGTGQNGGGIRSAGTLTILDAAIVGNTAGSGGLGGSAQGGSTTDPGHFGGLALGGNGGSGGNGGGIFSTGRLTLTRVVVSGNSAGAGGAGGLGVGGQGGSSGTGSGSSGGGGSGGAGVLGGSGGGIYAGLNTTIDQSTITQNNAGDGGAGGQGQGGPGGFGVTGGGGGQSGHGGSGGGGGEGGGVFGPAAITRTLVASNHAGDGGNGAKGLGGNGGQLIGPTGFAGSGGNGEGGDAGDGGDGGGLYAPGQGTLANLTIVDNGAGAGGSGGVGQGGNGAAASQAMGATGHGGSGGPGVAGDGGDAGRGGALIVLGPPSVEHATITGNALSGLGTAGAASGGGAGSGPTPGSAGSSFLGTNGAAASGGAVFAFNQTTLRNSIVAANAAPSCAGTVQNGDHDISFGDATCPGANVDPLLATLADNGGPSQTRLPGPGSPALDAVPAGAFCPLTDQRGATRPHGGGCEIGAYEIAPPDVAITEAAATVRGTVNPNARPATYHFEYGPSAAYGSSTPEEPLTAGVEPVAVSAALAGLVPGTTYHVRLVATNADGTGATADAIFATPAGGGSGSDVTAPVWQSASISPKTFRVNRRGMAEKPVASRVRRGTTFRYRLSEAARVVFTIQRRRNGRYVQARRFAKASKAGLNLKRFSGRIGRRALKPGRYRATLVATDAAGNRSNRKRLPFRVVR
jgi:CSLREA domain-containing protein